jgi:leader peptidase (prepilin peptidase) / N-methyltransferase
MARAENSFQRSQRKLAKAREPVQISILIPYVVWGVLGLVFGSFLNVCIARLPKGESIITPRSHCPRCGHLIRWYDNIPLVSYAFLGGRCRDCRVRISPIYPFVELLTAGIWVAGFARYELSPEFIKVTIFNMLVLIVVFTDVLERRVPHAVTVSGMIAGFLFCFLVPMDARPVGWILSRLGFFPGETTLSVLAAIAGALAGGGLFYAVGEAFYLASGRQKEYLGFGDVMLMLMVGVFLGAPLTLMTILLGSVVGTLVAVPLTLASARFRGYQWPYATFLGAAAIYASLWGPSLLEAYLRWAGFA